MTEKKFRYRFRFGSKDQIDLPTFFPPFRDSTDGWKRTNSRC